MAEEDFSHAPPVGPGQLVQLRALHLAAEELAISRGRLAISRRPLAIGGRFAAGARGEAARGSGSLEGELGGCVGFADLTGKGICLLVGEVGDLVALLGDEIAVAGVAIALFGLGIALGGDHGSNSGGGCSRHRSFVALGMGLFIRGQLARPLRRANGVEQAIGYGLFAIGDLLVGLRRRLVAIGEALVGIGAGLIGF